MVAHPIGRFELRILRRAASGDGGAAIQLFGPTDRGREQILRFDCFEKNPHYHLAVEYRRDDPYIPIPVADSFAWAVDKIRHDIPDLLAQAGASAMTRAERDELEKTLAVVQKP